MWVGESLTGFFIFQVDWLDRTAYISGHRTLRLRWG